MYRNTYLKIDLNKLERNAEIIKKISGHDEMYAVVKSNAYGHGIVQCAKAFLKGGATHLAVATLQEAITLRKDLNDVPILVLGYVDSSYFNIASKYAITITITNEEQINFLANYDDKVIKVHLKYDTGMNRIGFKTKEEIREAYSKFRYKDNVEVEGLFTHFASSSGDNIRLYRRQYEKFKEIAFEMQGLFKYVHCQNSGAIIFPIDDFSFCNISRPGIALYGYIPNGETLEHVEISPALELVTEICHVKKIRPGETVGYEGIYEAEKEVYIATAPIGYGDGLWRSNTNREIVINNKKYKIIGKICMDHVMIEVDESVKLGDVVEIIGPNISLEEIAKYLKTSSYEVMCSISARVPRVYFVNDEVLEIVT